ncbi:MAG: CHAT domain-containing protein [Deltaproteobacteria bacterium]|nr:MAG: CHAT domain-containing protein [Deltaproteobacteria bacterium]
MAEAGIAQIEMPLSLHPVFPAKSALRFPDNGRGTSDLQAWEFPALSLRSHLLLFSDVIAPEGDDARARDLLLLSHLLVAAGAPTLMLERIPLDPAARQRFLSRFYPELPERSVAEAVTIAAASFPETPFLVIGFAGMDARESRRFARQRFREDSRAGVRAFQRKAWREAVAAFERTLVDITYLREDEKFSRQVLPRILPILYSGLVEALANLHEDTRAIFHQERYIALLEAQGDRGTAARERESLALLYARQGRYDKALAALEAAYRYVQKEGSTAQQVDLLARMAEIHERDGHYRRALEMLEAGKALAQEAGLLPLAAAQAEDIGRIYNLRLSAYTLAERAYREALHFYEQLDDPQKEALLHLKLSLTRQRVGDYTGAAAEIARARALAPGIEEIALKADLYEANLAWYEARYSRAEHLQRRVIERARRLGKRRIEIQALNLEGLIARRLGDPQRALEAHGAALALAEQLDDPIEMAASLNNLGVIHREGGRFTEALQAFRRALEIDEALHDRLGQAYDQRNIGVTDLRRGRLNEARRALETAIAISREVNDVYNLVNALYALGIVLERSGDLGAATAAYTETLEITRNAYLPEFQWRALYALGKLDRQGGNRNRAFSRFREAIGIVERLRAQVEGEAARSGFLEDKLSLYEEMVSLLLEKGDVAAALHYAERARSRNFIDILGRRTLDLEDETATARLREAHRLESEIEALSAALARTISEEERAALAAERSRAEAAYAALIETIEAEDRELSDLLSVEPVSLEELRAHLPPSTALVAYLVTPGAVVIWTLVEGELDVVRVAVSREEVTALVVEFQQNLQRIGPVTEASEALYRILVAPVAERISGSPTLCLVPHGILHNLSFAALATGGRYLIEDHAIFVVPSATVYTLLSQRPPPPRIERILGVGNPDLGDPAFDLPFAQKEVLNLRRPFPTAEVFVREGATETLVKRRAPGHELIHLACHGFFDPRNPLDSKLKLRPDDANDGDLTAREIFGLDLGASLVTLSACRSGISKITRGDEIIGFTRAFLYAGTRSMLVSLWRVNDVTTAILVKHLYRNLGRFDKAESLRRAQLAVKAYHPHPTYWAPFILVGLP